MSEQMEVRPTPIQRNDKDVAVELTNLYYKIMPFNSADEIADTYLKFYATSRAADYQSTVDLVQFTSNELKSKFIK